MIAFGKTDKGMVRSSNQDNYCCGVFRDGAAWAVVCDGMGGAAGGDIASRCAVDTVKAILRTQYRRWYGKRRLSRLFTMAAQTAHREVSRRALEQPELSGMGTTIVIAVVKRGKAFIAHAGDSRAYIITDTARQLTRDHSVVQELVDSGRITSEAALRHPNRNIITRALGIGPEINIDFGVHKLPDNARVLLCTDGLTNCVSDEQLCELSCQTAASVLPDKYIAEANANGGYDNITAVIICE